jgi:ATP-dependent RNA helicase HelY
MAAEFSSGLPFELDEFQVKALGAVERGDSVLVSAPTGSGKTVVAEFACWLALRSGAKCFYTTPLKALSNQKFGDLIARHGARNVGLLTGDNTINGEAPLVVMTTEVLRNMIYERSSTLRGLRWVVMDEVHYLQDPYRGAVWEEVLIHLPPEVRAVSLSATVSNSRDFGAWLSELRGETEVVVEQRRPVELRNLIMAGDELHPLFADDGGRPALNPALRRIWDRGARFPARFGQAAPHRRHRPGDDVYTPSRVEMAEILQREKMLPAICFIFSRIGCEKAVESCLYSEVVLTTQQESERIGEFAELRAAMIEDEDLRALSFGTFLEALKRGVAAHHAGMLPVFKETVEELFALGLVKLVFATETLSLGINMPAKTVVIERLTKFNGERHEVLTPMDYTQLTGRAGRRGIDTLGYAVVLYTPWVPLDRISNLATAGSYPLTSSFRPSYNMAVNLVRNYDHETAVHLLNSSFAQFAADRDVVRIERTLETREREVGELRDKAACHLGDAAEYWRMRRQEDVRSGAGRGSEEVQRALVQLAPGDVIVERGLGRGLVVEQAHASSSGPRVTVVTTDRKLRRLGPRDFARPPKALAKIGLRGQSWRSPKVRRELARRLSELDGSGLRSGHEPEERRRPTGEQAWRSHPCHSCPEIAEHGRALDRAAQAESEAAGMRRRLRSRNTIARSFERVLDVLRTLGFVQGWSLTPKGDLLTRVYNESDILVVECLERGWLSGLDPEELAAVCSLFVYEARGRDEPRPSPSAYLSRYARRIADLYRRIHESEQQHGLELVKEPDPGFMSAIHAWASGSSLEDVLSEHELSPGDFVRSTKQVLDLLQQLRQAVPGGELADTLADSVRAVQRGVVAYSSVV